MPYRTGRRKSYCPPLGRTEDIANQIAQSDKNTIALPMSLALPVEDWAPPFKTGFARSKAKAMDPEIARNQNYDDHYANDSEDVHSALLPFHDDSARRARSSYVSVAIKLLASFRHRWLGATEASKYKPFLSPPPISPIAAPSEEQKEHEDNENEIHIFLQNVWWENFPPPHVGAE